jgi:hypothetical protein
MVSSSWVFVFQWLRLVGASTGTIFVVVWRERRPRVARADLKLLAPCFNRETSREVMVGPIPVTKDTIFSDVW